MKYSALIVCSLALMLGSCGNKKTTDKGGSNDTTKTQTAKDTCRYDQEKHLANIKMLTFGGENAEAYWSFDNTKFCFQRTSQDDSVFCDQIYMWTLADGDMRTTKPKLISTGKGRTTCSYFLPGDSLILYASTHKAGDDCPPTPERKKGAYYWPIYETMDIYVSNLKGEVVNQLTKRKGYDAEATVSPKGDLIVFTSDRSGDLELYTMNIDGSNVKQITNELGYDGGAFFSPDGTKIVYRASRPTADTTVKKYKDLLKQHLVEPSDMEIFVCNVDGTDKKQITHLGKANWAPFFHPSGNKIIFSSNHKSPKEFMFNLWMINLDGTALEQITFDPTFDAFPMFSPDGKKILFSSNRNNGGTRSTNLFVADWIE